MGCLCGGELPVMGSACEEQEAPRASLGSRCLWRGSYKGGRTLQRWWMDSALGSQDSGSLWAPTPIAGRL